MECTKRKHASRKRAKQWVRSRGSMHRSKTLRVYKCLECDFWHVTTWDAETTRITKEYRVMMKDHNYDED